MVGLANLFYYTIKYNNINIYNLKLDIKVIRLLGFSDILLLIH